MQQSTNLALSLFWGAVITLSLSIDSEAEIYKWVDSDGGVHFTDERPPDKGSIVELDVPAAAATPDEGEIRRLDLVRRVQLEAKQEAGERQKQRESAQPSVNQYSSGCKSARHRWYALTQEIPVYWTDQLTVRAAWYGDTYTGNREYIDDAERATLVEQAAKDIVVYCPNGEVDDEQGSQYAQWLRAEDCLVGQVRLEAARKKSSRTSKSELAKFEQEVGELCN